jgi:hypothetical protein
MPAPVIPASNPVVAPAIGSVTYNEWYLTQLIIKSNPTSCPAIVHLHRSAKDSNGNTILMPNGPGAEISFSVDIFQQLQAFPSLETAMESVLTAVITYANAKKLI